MKQARFVDPRREIAKNYWEKVANKSAMEKKVSLARRVEWQAIRSVFQINLKTEKRIADLACGTGFHAILFLKEGFKVTGIDTSKTSLKMLEKRADEIGKSNNLKTVCNDLSDRWLEQKFDAGYMICSYHCLSLNQQERFRTINNFIKSIKVNGKFFMMEPNPLNPLFFLFYPFVYGRNWREGLNLIYSQRRMIEKDVSRAGIGKLTWFWYGFLPTFLVNRWPFVAQLNRFFCRLPLINSFCAFNLMIGRRIK